MKTKRKFLYTPIRKVKIFNSNLTPSALYYCTRLVNRELAVRDYVNIKAFFNFHCIYSHSNLKMLKRFRFLAEISKETLHSYVKKTHACT